MDLAWRSRLPKHAVHAEIRGISTERPPESYRRRKLRPRGSRHLRAVHVQKGEQHWLVTRDAQSTRGCKVDTWHGHVGLVGVAGLQGEECGGCGVEAGSERTRENPIASSGWEADSREWVRCRHRRPISGSGPDFGAGTEYSAVDAGLFLLSLCLSVLER